MTVFADKLKQAGMDTGRARLDALLFKRLGDLRRPDARVVARNSIAEVWGDLELLQALVGWSLVERMLFDRAEECERSMKNTPKGVAGVHGSDFKNHAEIGARDSTEGDAVHNISGGDDIQLEGGPSPSTQSEVDAIQSERESHISGGPSSSRSNRSDAVQTEDDSHEANGRVVPIQNKPRGLREVQRMRELSGPSIFDTCTIRGESLAKMAIGRLRRLRFDNLFESALATLILNYKITTDDMLVTDVVSDKVLSKMILEAQEIANAA